MTNDDILWPFFVAIIDHFMYFSNRLIGSIWQNLSLWNQGLPEKRGTLPIVRRVSWFWSPPCPLGGPVHAPPVPYSTRVLKVVFDSYFVVFASFYPSSWWLSWQIIYLLCRFLFIPLCVVFVLFYLYVAFTLFEYMSSDES